MIRNTLGRINRKDSKLNILTCPTHERYETGLAMTGHNFYGLDAPGVKKWNKEFGKRPDNYKIIGSNDLDSLHIDIVLVQHKFGQFQFLTPIADFLNVPSIVLEHTLAIPQWTQYHLDGLKVMKGDINIFISKHSREKWGWTPEEAYVVEHGINIDLFNDKKTLRKNVCLSVVNDWINRDLFCGYNIWKEAMVGLPVQVYGGTPGLSKPANGISGLVDAYNSHRIFVNTSTVSPIPTSLMEAMACGCAVISTNTCMIPEVVKDGYNGVLCNNAKEIRNAAITLLENPELCAKLGNNARESIVKKYNMDRFVKRWNEIFNYAGNLRRGC